METDASNWQGQAHPGNKWAAFTTISEKIYIFGGYFNYDYVNDICTLSAAGEFTRLQPTGNVIPDPRFKSQAWSYEEKGCIYVEFRFVLYQRIIQV